MLWAGWVAIRSACPLLSEVHVKTAQSHVLSKTLICAGFIFVGLMIDCVFMPVMEVVSDHLVKCLRCIEIKMDF